MREPGDLMIRSGGVINLFYRSVVTMTGRATTRVSYLHVYDKFSINHLETVDNITRGVVQ